MGRTELVAAVCLGWSLVWASPLPADEPVPTPAQLEFFESKVRPVLAANCFNCHGPDKQKAGLRLDSLASMLEGGDSGPAVRPGRPDESPLIEAIRYGEERQMPPKSKLKEDEIAALTEWVKGGAIWPGTELGTRPARPASGPKVDAEDRAFWSFRPVKEV